MDQRRFLLKILGPTVYSQLLEYAHEHGTNAEDALKLIAFKHLRAVKDQKTEALVELRKKLQIENLKRP